MCGKRMILHAGSMTTAPFTPAMGGKDPRGSRAAYQDGATALLARPKHQRHLVGNTLRVVRVFASTAFAVIVLGQSDEDAGVYRRKATRPSRHVQPASPSTAARH